MLYRSSLIDNRIIDYGRSMAGVYRLHGFESNMNIQRDHQERFDPVALLTECQAAQLLGFTPRCLQAWRQRGGGPMFVRISARAIRYRRRDIIAWAESRLKSSTSEE